jgi:Predicted transcriptional regulators
MSLKYALLGFLNYQSMTGYQLKKHFDESISNFWNASLSQIYPTLNQMCEQSLLTVEVIQQDSTPNAKVYHITNTGKDELLKWLTGPIEFEPMRSSLLVKLFFSSCITKDQVISLLVQTMSLAKKNLKLYQDSKNHFEKDHASESTMKQEAFYWTLTVDYGIKNAEAIIAWCEGCVKKIQGDLK